MQGARARGHRKRGQARRCASEPATFFASEIAPAEEPPQGLWGRDAEIIPHDQSHAGASRDGSKDRLLHNVETGRLHKRHQQIDLGRARETVDKPRPEWAIRASGQKKVPATIFGTSLSRVGPSVKMGAGTFFLASR